MSCEAPIGIFDSGVGGLTVLKEVRRAMPNESVIYLGDTLNFPYGPKSKEEIIEYSIENAEFLIEKGAKLIVVACGTATSQALDVLKERCDIPIIGIIEPTVAYIKTINPKQIRGNSNRRNDKKRCMGKGYKERNSKY